MSHAILAEEVTKEFREGNDTLQILRGASLVVPRGEIVAIEGPSGSGKTTFISIIGCLLAATGGRVEVAGQAVDAKRPTRLAEIRKKHLGFVFQQFNLFPALTALENVQYALNLKGVSGQRAKQEASELLDRVGLADRKNFLPRDMSGGQKQRIAIARALCGRPDVILADEPTASLDAVVAEQVLTLFQELARQDGRAVLIVTHDSKVRRITDRVVRIDGGRIAA
ncbi:MAG TPA: ABC transporter ATP-binding protein [Polyangiaceae bacterium]|nr:ABC transporter ATP-binding protein [Polyangiaceae bacterium]